MNCVEFVEFYEGTMFMPTYDRSQRMWFCNGCGASYQKKPEALACEALHGAWKNWAEGKITDLQLAAALGYDVSTEEKQRIALQRIKDLTTGGRDHTFQEKVAGAPAPAFGGAKGNLVGMTTMVGNGRVQVPAQIRRQLGLQDGHNVFWYELGGRYFISPRELSTTYQRGKWITVEPK